MANKKLFQIIIPLVIFLIITFVYLSPLLQGKAISGSDTIHFKGMAKEIIDYRDQTGKEALWTNALFGGMPAYLISTLYPGNLLSVFQEAFNLLPRPAGMFILNFSLFFLLLLMLRLNPWVSMVGALAYGFNTAFFVWIDTGHMSKADTVTYMALVVAGVLYAYKEKRWVGGLVAGIGLSAMLHANHPQMTYYAGIMVAIIGITYLVYAIKEKMFLPFLKTSAVLLLAAVLAFGANFSRLYTVYEYGKYSMRGASELTSADGDQTKGLSKSYILDYSYDLGEAITAFIPRFKGGGMAEPLGENSNFFKELEITQGKARAQQISKQAPLYWGSQPISGAPFYYGAVLCFLFVFGLFMVKGRDKWWIVATVVVAFLLSLGKNIPALAHFMIDYFPAYNKFRDVKNIISIQHFAMALMGVLAIKELYQRNIENKLLLNKLKWAFGITGGFAFLFVLFPGIAGSFTGNTDAQMAQMGWPQKLIDALRYDRQAVLRADAFKAFLFVALAAATIWAFWAKKIKAQYAVAIWALLILADMWPINKRYFNNDDFVTKRKAEAPYSPTPANLEILKDKDLNYRVLNLSLNPFTDASTSYFHKSVGGYHGAKMQRYQELIENRISTDMQTLNVRLRAIQGQEDIDKLFKGLNTLNMLNTRYLIYNGDAAPLFNAYALGNAWFVEKVEWADNADQEIEKINFVNIAKTAVVDQRYKSHVNSLQSVDTLSTIELIEYAPNRLVYRSESNAEQLAVFSEVFYPKGWKASINGIETAHFAANYVLRAMVLPAGKNEIVFEFKPNSYFMGKKVSVASSLIMLLLIAGTVYFEIKKRKKITTDEE
jgi:hypothetical protein